MTGDTTPISDEAIEAYRRAESTGRTAGLLARDYTRRGLAAAAPLLVSAEAERSSCEDERCNEIAEMVACDVVDLLDRSLSHNEFEIERLTTEVEGLRAELAAIRDDSDLSDAIGYAYALAGQHRKPGAKPTAFQERIVRMLERHGLRMEVDQ